MKCSRIPRASHWNEPMEGSMTFFAPSAVAPVRMAKAPMQIIRYIRQGILEGSLKPGDRLPVEQELIAQCGQLGDMASEKNVAVDLIFFREAPEGSALTGALESRYVPAGTVNPLHRDVVSRSQSEGDILRIN